MSKRRQTSEAPLQVIWDPANPDMHVAGVDEAGRGAGFGDVFAAAVIWDPRCSDVTGIRDSKQLTAARREAARARIQREAIAWHVASVDAATIDRVNILQATYQAMHAALQGLAVRPDWILVDGNRWAAYEGAPPYTCVVGGDGVHVAIAAASILAKTARDDHVAELLRAHPEELGRYGLDRHRGYLTAQHIQALAQWGPSRWHRLSFAKVGPRVSAE